MARHHCLQKRHSYHKTYCLVVRVCDIGHKHLRPPHPKTALRALLVGYKQESLGQLLPAPETRHSSHKMPLLAWPVHGIADKQRLHRQLAQLLHLTVWGEQTIRECRSYHRKQRLVESDCYKWDSSCLSPIFRNVKHFQELEKLCYSDFCRLQSHTTIFAVFKSTRAYVIPTKAGIYLTRQSRFPLSRV